MWPMKADENNFYLIRIEKFSEKLSVIDIN